jgi:spore germination protein KB
MLLVLPHAKIENLLPVFEEGVVPVLKGSILLSSFLIFPVVLMLMIFPVLADNTIRAKKSFIKGYLWGGGLVFISVLFSIMVLGSTIASASQYPVFILAKEINVRDIFSRLEFIVAAVWIIMLLTRGIIYFYGAVTGISLLLGLKKHETIILPLGLIIMVMSGMVYSDVIYQSDWDTLIWPPFAGTFGIVIPIILYIVFLIKKWVFKHME